MLATFFSFMFDISPIINVNTAGLPGVRYRNEVYARCYDATDDMIDISAAVISICTASPFHVPNFIPAMSPSLTGNKMLDHLINELSKYDKMSTNNRYTLMLCFLRPP